MTTIFKNKWVHVHIIKDAVFISWMSGEDDRCKSVRTKVKKAIKVLTEAQFTDKTDEYGVFEVLDKNNIKY